MSADQRSAKPPARVLACALCQQRKIKCDRKFPCANCRRADAQCIPLAPTKQRRRRFPERELLDRLRHYEELLRRNNIPFEPMNPTVAPDERAASDVEEASASPATSSTPGNTAKATEKSKAMNLFHAMSRTILDGDQNSEDDESDSGFLGDTDHVRESVIKRAWDQTYENDKHDPLLFGSPKTTVDLSNLHPSAGKILKLWQIYLENVNPLLKVTHTPTLQASFIDAASDVTSISPALEALMFSIYGIAVQSLSNEDCASQLGGSKKDFMETYLFGCHQALTNCRVLQSSDRNCLTALYLYLISIRPDTDPRSLSSMLAIAVRIGQRIGIHDESLNRKCAALEAEMRRRLWWSLVLYDRRVCEMSDHKTSTLDPTWDCCLPLNISDFEIRSEMKTVPMAREGATDAQFAVVRSELGEYLRQSDFHIGFTSPSMLKLRKHLESQDSHADDLDVFAKRIEEKYLAFCNADNPFDQMTVWTARSQIAKFRLLDHYYRHADSSSQHQNDAQRDTAMAYALDMIECDTQLMGSAPKGYKWFNDFHFPFPAYIHVLQDLKQRPTAPCAARAWEVMSLNHEVRMTDITPPNQPFFIIFSRLVLQAWAAQEASLPQQTAPRIVASVQEQLVRMTSGFRTPQGHSQQQQQQPSIDSAMHSEGTPISTTLPMGLSVPAGSEEVQGGFSLHPGQLHLSDTSMDGLDWTAFDWAPMHGPTWS